MFRSLLIVSIFLLSGTASAGQSIRNGGNAVVCTQGDGTTTAYLLDFFEEFGEAGAASLSIEGATSKEKLLTLISKIAIHSPLRASRYNEVAQRLPRPENFVSGNFPSVNDIGKIRRKIPANCGIRQVAIQVPNELSPWGRRVLIDKNLYSLLSAEHQAGLLLHELVFMELANWGVKDSSHFRSFVASRASSHVANESLLHFLNQLFSAGFLTYEYAGLSLSFMSERGEVELPKMCNERKIRSAFPVFHSVFQGANQPFSLKGELKFACAGYVEELTTSTETSLIIGAEEVLLPSGAAIFLNSRGLATTATVKSIQIRQTAEGPVRMAEISEYRLESDGSVSSNVTVRPTTLDDLR